MLDLPEKFKTENKKGTKTRAAIVKLQDVVIEAGKTLQSHWSANTSESNVDYTPSPPNIGEVELLKPETWTQLTSGAAVRSGHSAIENNGKMYIFGGAGPSYLNDLWEYDIAGDSWIQLTSGATARAGHSAIEYNGKMYIFGGHAGSTGFNTIWEYDIEGDSWTQLTSGATARFFHSAIEYNGKMYIFGGDNLSVDPYNDVWEYDIDGDSWTQLTSGATKRFGHTAIEYDGKMYIFAGSEFITGRVNSIWEYDIIGDSWISLTSGATVRTYHTAIEFNGKIYIFGGQDGSGNLNDVWEYNIAADLWTQKTSGATARFLHSAIEYKGEMYIFGGYSTTYLNDVWDNIIGYSLIGHLTTDNFDLGSVPTSPGEWTIGDVVPAGTSLTYEAWSSATGLFNVWTYLSQGATARTGHSIVIYNGKIYLFGGADDSGYLNDVWEYNISSRIWTELSPSGTPPAARAFHTAIEYSGKMYVFGGLDVSSSYNDLYELDLSTFAWSSPSTTGGPPDIRFNHTAIEYTGKMYIFAGVTNDPLFWFNDVWELNLTTFAWLLKSTTGTAPTIRQGGTAIEYSGKMYTFGGRKNPTYYNDVHELNLSTFVWTPKSPTGTPPSTRYGHTSIEYSGKMYTFGGQNGGTYYDDAHVLDLTTFLWAVGPQLGTAPDARSFHGALLNGNEMLLFGGQLGSSKIDDLWSSGALNGNATSIGTVIDGDAITDLKQYYRVKASFVSSPNRDKTPILQNVTTDFSTYIDVIAHASPGSLSGLESIGTLSTEISDFKPTTISSMTLTFPFNKRISAWFASRYPKNRIAKVKYGFIGNGFMPADYIDRFFGQIEDWKISSSGMVTVTIYSFHKEWKTQIPEKWVDASDNQAWEDVHPVDVILNILQNFLTVRDSKIDFASFYAVRDALPGWKVTRTITENTEEAKEMMEQLRSLMTCYFTLHGDGSVGLKRWDANETPVASLSDKDFLPPGPSWAANAKGLINEVFIYFAHGEDGAGNYTTPTAGDDAVDFRDLGTDFDGDSIDNWQETAPKVLKDKWTRSTKDAQVTTRVANVLDRYKDPRSLLSVSLSGKWIALETGDIVNITTKRYPSTDFTGCTDKPFQIVKMTPNWLKKSGAEINLVLLEV